MKNSKNGFTLMELLLSIGIIGIISAMGMTIAKQGSDKAFDLFYYFGYKNLYDVCIDAHLTQNNSNEANDSSKTILATHLNDFLGQVGKDGKPKAEINAENFAFTTNNGIQYEVQDGLGGNVPYIIQMQIPYKKTSTGDSKTVKFYYYMDSTRFSIPYLIQVTENGVTDLMRNTLLLPTYIDDGIVGRRNGGTYTPIVYDNLHNNLCLRAGTLTSTTGVVVLDCSDVINPNSVNASIKFSDPRNIKYRKS